MRWPTSVVTLASLAACTDTGAHLTLSAPEGAKTFQVVLATPDHVPEIRNQRLAPGDRSTTEVRYFLQRTLAGVDTDTIDDVDGFTVRIAPDTSVPDTQFIPFVMMYDEAGAITGIGTYRAGEDNLPSPILVMRDEIDKYKLQVEKTAQVADPSEELAPGELRVVTCDRDDQSSFTSGVVWRTLAGTEYRLLFPKDGSLDATGRALDMDCDNHEVTAESSYADCDDTRGDFYRDAPDTCDGKDTNCDGASTIATACNVQLNCQSPFMGSNGVELCDDETQARTDCAPTATCACSGGATSSCRICKVPTEQSLIAPGGGALHPCQPAIGTLHTRICSDTSRCDVELLAVRGGWKIKISAANTNAFSSTRAYDVGENLAIKAERPEGPAWETPGDEWQAADIDLAILTANATVYVPLQLQLDDPTGAACGPAPTMLCY